MFFVANALLGWAINGKNIREITGEQAGYVCTRDYLNLLLNSGQTGSNIDKHYDEVELGTANQVTPTVSKMTNISLSF